MDQSQYHPPPPGPASGPGNPPGSIPGRPSGATHSDHVVHVVARSGGFARAVWFVVGLCVFAGVFIIGATFGAVTFAAGSMFDAAVVEEVYRNGKRDTVAIIPIQGFIDGAQVEVIRTQVDHVLSDLSIEAAVLRVESLGGAVAASDQIWYQVKRLTDAGLPVIASYGAYATSGGYYVSCGADHIVAEPTCITGSIGVIAQTFILKDLLDKVGIEPVTLLATNAQEKDVGNPFRSWTDKDRERYIHMLDAAYETFSQRVKQGRRNVISDPAKIDELADGSIYTAQEAVDNGLVDTIGYLDDAITQAERAAGLPIGQAHVVILRQPAPLFSNTLFMGRGGTNVQGLDTESIRSAVNDLATPRVMYLTR